MEKAYVVPESINYDLTQEVRDEVVKLPTEKQKEFVKEFKKKRKSIGVTYILWLLFWGNHAYLKKWGIQIFS